MDKGDPPCWCNQTHRSRGGKKRKEKKDSGRRRTSVKRQERRQIATERRREKKYYRRSKTKSHSGALFKSLNHTFKKKPPRLQMEWVMVQHRLNSSLAARGKARHMQAFLPLSREDAFASAFCRFQSVSSQETEKRLTVEHAAILHWRYYIMYVVASDVRAENIYFSSYFWIYLIFQLFSSWMLGVSLKASKHTNLQLWSSLIDTLHLIYSVCTQTEI